MISTVSQPHTKQRLDSWKEIAAFFERDERTVRRWELERGLPVHRVPGSKGRIYAYTDELTAWLSPRNSAALLSRPDPAALPEPKELSAPLVFIDGSDPSIEPASPAEPSTQPSVLKNRWKTAGWTVAALLAAAVLLSLAWSYRSPVPGPDSIAVLPFANGGGDANADYLSDGITESLIDNLAHIPELKVRSRNSVFRYKGMDVDIQKTGNDLGVAALVSGRVIQRGANIEVSAELTNVRDNTVIWGQHYSRKSAEIISLQQEIAGDIAEKLRSKLSVSEKRQVTRLGTQSPEAYDLYLKGRYAWNRRTPSDLATAISYFNQAIAKDPGYALAYSGLADAYAVLPNFWGNPSEDFPKSNAAARKALDLDPTLAHPHAVLGENEMQYDWDFAGGEAEFKKAFALDPNDATARQWYADDIGMIGGRQQEALEQVNLAHQLDPQSPVITRVAGGIYVWGRRFDDAIGLCQKLANENPKFAIAHDCLAYAYWGKRMYPQVIAEWKAEGQLAGDPEMTAQAAAMELGFRSSGWNGAVMKCIETMESQRRTGYFSPFQIARLYADVGEKDQAFRWLDTAYQEHDWSLIGLKTNAQFDSIRSDPRFVDLVRKVGLPQ